MYREYWGLSRAPFENISDSSFFFYSSQHKEALARMCYAIQEKKIGMFLTGEYGTGKTFLSRVVKKHLPDDKYTFIFITNPRLDLLEFLKEILFQLGGDLNSIPHATKMDILRSIHERLEAMRKENIYPVMIIDEAQSIQDDNLLEEIRMLVNIQSEEAVLFTPIILGQPDLEQRIEMLPQLKQRLPIRYRLAQLTEEGTKEYVNFRLSVAGCTRQIFADDSFAGICSLSKGMPRAINNICDLALLTAFLDKAESVGKEIVLRVGRDLGELTLDLKEEHIA